MDALARREHSRHELEQKLADHGFPHDTVTTTLDKLAAESLQSDARFIEAFIASRFRQGKGPVRIRAELSQRGVPAEDVAKAIKVSEFDWLQLAKRVRRSKFGDYMPEDFKERARQMRFLSYRGFDSELVRIACGD